MLGKFMRNCTRDAGVLVLYNIYMHANSVFPLCVNYGSALAELLHCAVQSGRALMQRASCSFRIWKAVTLTAPRETGREIWSSSNMLVRLSECCHWQNQFLRQFLVNEAFLLESICCLVKLFVSRHANTARGSEKCPPCKLLPVKDNISATEAIGVKYILGDL